MGKFIENKYTDDWEVLTENGWKDFKGVGKTVKYKVYEVITETHSLKCADDHLIKTNNGFKYSVNLTTDDLVSTSSGYEKFKNIIEHEEYDNMYDLSDVDGSEYLTNNITSHNTVLVSAYILWYCMFNSDKTIGIVSNKEKSAKDILKRIKGIYEEIPYWMKPGVELYNILGVLFDNNTEIMVSATSPDAFRGRSINCVSGDTKVCVIDDHGNIFYTSIEKANSSCKEKIMEILTQNGFKKFDGFIEQNYEGELIKFELSNNEMIKCTIDHKFLLINGKYEYAKNIHKDDVLYNNIKINSKDYIKSNEKVYDALNVEDVNSYYTNGIISHNCLFADELAFVPSNIADEFWAANYPTLSASTTSKIIVISTPNGTGNLFHSLYVNAERGENGFAWCKYDYTVIPGRDAAWVKQEIKILGEQKFFQEHSCVGKNTHVYINNNGKFKKTTIGDLYNELSRSEG